MIISKRPSYLYDLLPFLQRSHQNKNSIQSLFCKMEFFKGSFLRYTIIKWNKLNPKFRRIDLDKRFWKMLLTFVRPTEKYKPFCIDDHLGIKLLNRSRSNFSHLKEYKFKHNFANTLCKSSMFMLS